MRDLPADNQPTPCWCDLIKGDHDIRDHASGTAGTFSNSAASPSSPPPTVPVHQVQPTRDRARPPRDLPRTVAITSPPFRVETIRVRHAGRRPMMVAALAVALVAVSIIKPWAGTGQAQPDPSRASPIPAGVVEPMPTASAPGLAETGEASTGTAPGPLAPGQVDCGSADWRIVTLGDFLGWTVRTWIAITPVEADGPGDSSIPDLALGESDIVGLGACAPSAWAGAPGRASRIVAAWRISADGATTSKFGRVALAPLDPLPPDGLAGTRPAVPLPVAELVRPITAAQGGRWPAGRYVLLLASPDASPGRWISVVIGHALGAVRRPDVPPGAPRGGPSVGRARPR